MEVLKDWIIGICAVSVLAAVVQALAPKNTVFGNIKMICALLLVVAIIAPLKKLDIGEFRVHSRKIEREVDMKTQSIAEENQKIKQDIIENTLSAYILKRASQNGDEIEVSVQCTDDIPQSVAITARKSSVTGKTLEMIEQECGISRDKIVVKYTED